MFRYIAALVSAKRKKYTIKVVSELTPFYLIIRFGWSSFSVGRGGTQNKNRFFCKPHYNQNQNLSVSKHRLTIIIFYLGLPSNPGGSGVSAVLPTSQTFIKISVVAISGVLCGPNTTCISVSFVRDSLPKLPRHAPVLASQLSRKSSGRSNLEVVGSSTTEVKFSQCRGDSQVSR